jgi:hypothetical protein
MSLFIHSGHWSLTVPYGATKFAQDGDDGSEEKRAWARVKYAKLTQ